MHVTISVFFKSYLVRLCMVTCVLAVCECKCVYKCMYVCVCMDMCVYMCVFCMCVVLCSPHCTCACTHVVTLSSIGFDMWALDYCLVVLLMLWSGAERLCSQEGWLHSYNALVWGREVMLPRGLATQLQCCGLGQRGYAPKRAGYNAVIVYNTNMLILNRCNSLFVLISEALLHVYPHANP